MILLPTRNFRTVGDEAPIEELARNDRWNAEIGGGRRCKSKESHDARR